MATSILVAEFEKWNEENVDGNIYLLEATEKEDGTSNILFSLCGEHDFVLYCPQGYPQNQDRFVVETSANMQSWANNLNEFLLDSSVSPRLNNILNRAVQLYNNSGTTNVSSDDETLEDEDESEMGCLADDETFTTEWELKLARHKKRWLQKEAQIREEMKTKHNKQLEEITPIKGANDKSQAKQIFSNCASSGILTNDLVAIMKDKKVSGVIAEPIDDNIYLWSVKLFKFDSGSALDEDLSKIKEKFNYDYIELNLEFTMDLYPFYPPHVKVVRPRLQHAMMQRVSSMKLLKLSFWNPARDMLSVLQEIKSFLQQWARLEVDTDRNDTQLYSQGAYLEIEHHLLRLALVGEIYPRVNSKYTLQQEELPTISFVDKASKPKEYWAAGTGYGSGKSKRDGWDVKAYIAAQKLKDEQVVSVLQSILAELRQRGIENNPHLQNGSSSDLSTESAMEIEVEGASSEPLTNSDSGISVDVSQAGSSTSNSSLGCRDGINNGIVNGNDDLFDVLENSCLIPFLESRLKACSFLEICRHSLLYSAIVDVIKEIAQQSRLVPLLGPLPFQEQSIVDILLHLKQEASQILDRVGKVEANGSIPQLAQDDSKPSTISVPPAEEKIAREFSTLHLVVSSRLNQEYKDKFSNPSSSSDGVTSLSQEPDEVLYRKCLKQYQFENYCFAPDGPSSHYYARAYVKANQPNSSQVFRIAQDLSSLSVSLPLNLSSSIFIRVDENKFTLLRVVITGPEGTPYSGGCYQFDVYFPDKYPLTPPSVQLMTTGNGTVRFNPNLYASGKVCLSLLGTWHGQHGEQWNETSTLLQVLVSIQSLIMVPEPYFNEPGYETQIGTERGKKQSDQYNEEIRINNIRYAMIEQLKNPTAGFEDVIRLHFFLQKKRILQEVNSWMSSSKSSNLSKWVQQLEKELCKLQLSTDLQDIVQSRTEEPQMES